MYVYNDVYVYIVYVYMCMCPHMYTLICFSEKYAYPLRLEKTIHFLLPTSQQHTCSWCYMYLNEPLLILKPELKNIRKLSSYSK